jgi:hypothetical protein
MGIVALDDHPGVLLQFRCVEHLEQGLGHPLDQPRLEVRGEPALEQLDANERHLLGHVLHEIGSVVRNVVEGHGGDRLHERHAAFRVKLVVQAAVDGNHVASVSVLVSPSIVISTGTIEVNITVIFAVSVVPTLRQCATR